MKQDTRLGSIIDMLPSGHCVGDIGTDHGFLAINAIESGKVSSAVASDISEKSLEKAVMNIEKAGYTDCITTCVANGFQHEGFNQIDLAIIAGMGGDLITRIFDQSPNVVSHIKSCIVQPMTKITAVRKWVLNNPFCIVDENLIDEKGKYYFIFRIDHSNKQINNNQSTDELGSILIEKKHPLLYGYTTKKIVELEFKLNRLKEGKSERAIKQKQEVIHQLIKLKELKSWSATFKK